MRILIMLKYLFRPVYRIGGDLCRRFGHFRESSTHQNRHYTSQQDDLDNFYNVKISGKLQELLEESTDLNEQIRSQQPYQPSLQEAIQEKLRYEWTYHSNALEGSTLSLGDTIFFLKDGLTVQGKPFKDYVDAQNHSKAIDFFLNVVADKIPLSSHLMCQINSLLMQGIETIPAIDQHGRKVSKPTHPGLYKKEPNHVLMPNGKIHYYVEPLQVAAQMDFLFNWINKNMDDKHPILTSAIGHYNMVRIHPFDDANGRGSRILMNLILMKRNYPVTVIKNEDRQVYLECLSKGDNKDLKPFVEFIANVVISSQKMIIEEIKRFEEYNQGSVSKKT